MSDIINQLVGLEVLEVFHRKDGAVGMLFDDGIIVFIPAEGEVVMSQGAGWETMWNNLKAA